MALIYLLDTNALSEAARSAPNSIVLARLQANAGQSAIAATTWHELWFGLYQAAATSRKQEVVERFLQGDGAKNTHFVL
jgi:predicted nucleic acid-binding protein